MNFKDYLEDIFNEVGKVLGGTVDLAPQEAPGRILPGRSVTVAITFGNEKTPVGKINMKPIRVIDQNTFTAKITPEVIKVLIKAVKQFKTLKNAYMLKQRTEEDFEQAIDKIINRLQNDIVTIYRFKIELKVTYSGGALSVRWVGKQTEAGSRK